jgi:large subunit ribosomal protein L22
MSKATASYISMSPFKLRRVANVVRGLPVERALAVLQSLPHRGAKVIGDVIRSAAANAVNNSGAAGKRLKVAQLLINEGPRHKRFQPRARGRIYQILKRTCHVSVGLESFEGEN